MVTALPGHGNLRILVIHPFSKKTFGYLGNRDVNVTTAHRPG